MRSWFTEERLRQAMPVVALVVLVVVIGAVRPDFFRPSTLLIMASDTATLYLLGVGVTFVIILGGIDLSVQSIASLASVVLAVTLPSLGVLAFALAVLVGGVTGAGSGIAHVKLKIPSFIATLAIGGIAAGVALLISDARSIPMGATERTIVGWVTGKTLGIPHEIFIIVAVLVVSGFIQRYTTFGRYCQAIGAGEPAAFASGVKVDLHKIGSFTLSGAFAGLAGVVLASRLTSGSPTLAAELLLPAIAAVIVGGTAITGGVGSTWNTLIGALIVTVIRTGMTFVGVDIFAQNIVFGAILIVAVAATIDRSKIPIVK